MTFMHLHEPAEMTPVPFGDAMRLLRKQAGLKQSELAARVGISEGHLSKIEHGARTPSAEVMDKLTREFARGYK